MSIVILKFSTKHSLSFAKYNWS